MSFDNFIVQCYTSGCECLTKIVCDLNACASVNVLSAIVVFK